MAQSNVIGRDFFLVRRAGCRETEILLRAPSFSVEDLEHLLVYAARIDQCARPAPAVGPTAAATP